MPTENDLALLLNQIPGLKEWVRTQVVSTLARRVLTWLAMLLIGAGLLSPNGQDAFITDNLETAVGVLLELGVVAMALLSVRKRGDLVQKAVLADPTATLAEVEANSKNSAASTVWPQNPALLPTTEGMFVLKAEDFTPEQLVLLRTALESERGVILMETAQPESDSSQTETINE